MECFTEIPFSLNLPELMERMHLDPEGREAGPFRALAQKAEEIGRPKAAYREAYIESRSERSVTVGGVTFDSTALARNLDGLGRVFPFLATCGREMEQTPFEAGDLLAAYEWSFLQQELLSCELQHLKAHLERRYRLGTSAAMSPGSGDEHIWPIEQQRLLFGILGDLPDAVGVALTESGMMTPVKTVSGVRFAGRGDFRTCTVCRRRNCPNRSAPFDPELWESLH
jgi:hypothetical protein